LRGDLEDKSKKILKEIECPGKDSSLVPQEQKSDITVLYLISFQKLKGFSFRQKMEIFSVFHHVNKPWRAVHTDIS
jgi:hypothetical protein